MDRHSDTNRRIMTEKEFNELVFELEKQGYKKTTSTPYGNEDYGLCDKSVLILASFSLM